MSWLNSDAYSKGYDKGVEDAKNRKKRNPLSPLTIDGWKSLTALDQKQYMDTYTDGYREGYKMQKAKTNQIFTTERNKTNTKAMSGGQGLKNQVELLEMLDLFFETLCTYIINTQTIYQNTLEDLRDSGYITEFLEELENDCFAKFCETATKITNKVRESDQGYAKRLKDNIAKHIKK